MTRQFDLIASALDGTNLIEASADTGKTYTISGIYLRLLLEKKLAVEIDGVATDPWGGERVSITARGEIDREEFGLTWNVALEGGGVLVSKKIVLEIEAQGVRQN